MSTALASTSIHVDAWCKARVENAGIEQGRNVYAVCKLGRARGRQIATSNAP